jgi:hypothetical protein
MHSNRCLGALILLKTALLAFAGCAHQSPPAKVGSGSEPVPEVPREVTFAVDLISQIPPCRVALATISPRDIPEQRAETSVSVMGVLVHPQSWTCTQMACSETGPDGKEKPSPCCNGCSTPLLLVDFGEASRPRNSPVRLFLRRRDAPATMFFGARDCNVDTINRLVTRKNVVATGIFAGPAPGEPEGSYLLDKVDLCAV